MPRKPTPASVSSAACRCFWLQDAANEPEVPVIFDEKYCEYHVEHRDGGYSVIRHCPWCGGVAPPSRRPSLFAVVPKAEWRRLGRLTAGLKSVEEALARLGEPDERHSEGLTVEMPRNGRRPQRAESYPTMTFSELSEVADVTLSDTARRTSRYRSAPSTSARRSGPRLEGAGQ